jgi:hypothetical protein
VLCQVTSLMHGQSLNNVHMESNETEALKPFDFRLHVPHILPTVTGSSQKITRRRWMQAHYILDQYWARWMQHYVPKLIEQQKCFHTSGRLGTGDDVIIISVNTHHV